MVDYFIITTKCKELKHDLENCKATYEFLRNLSTCTSLLEKINGSVNFSEIEYFFNKELEKFHLEFEGAVCPIKCCVINYTDDGFPPCLSFTYTYEGIEYLLCSVPRAFDKAKGNKFESESVFHYCKEECERLVGLVKEYTFGVEFLEDEIKFYIEEYNALREKFRNIVPSILYDVSEDLFPKIDVCLDFK